MLGVGLLTAYRIVLLALDRTDLFVDEAQYWLWGQSLEFGYYSKPPLIGWTIRAVTELAGSDAPFWVRLPGSIFHAATAMVLGALAARLWGGRAGVITALAYTTLPLVAVGSLLISTDTIMFPFLAAALLFWTRATEGSAWAAPAAGAMLGLAFLGKYAALYYVIGAILAALFLREARVKWAQAGLASLAFLAVISPNIVWNIANGLSTVEHTLDNADWVRDPGRRAALNFAGLGDFLGAQFAVFGPILMGALLWLALRWPAPQRRWLLFAVPVLLLVCAQALLSKAYANWAVAAYLAGLIAVVPWLMARPKLLIGSFAVNGLFALVLPILPTLGDTVSRNGQPVLNRYLGRAEMTQALLTLAGAENARVLVADHRDLLADLFYTGRDSDFAFRAVLPDGRPRHHYAQRYPFEGADTPVLFASFEATSSPPCAATELVRITPKTGAYSKHPVIVYRVPGNCWADR